jgi:hypothetical protein
VHGNISWSHPHETTEGLRLALNKGSARSKNSAQLFLTGNLQEERTINLFDCDAR